MNCKILSLQCKPKLACTKPLMGRIAACGLDIGGLESRPMCLAIAGVANQSETKSNTYCVTAKIHMYIIHGHT